MLKDTGDLSGFSGSIGRVRLMDLIQLACLAQMSHAIELESRAGQGRIHIRSGQVVHALAGEAEGEAALFEMLQWGSGRFDSAPSTDSITQSINKNWEYLLMEAIRLSRPPSDGARATDTSIPAEDEFDAGFDGRLREIQLADLVQLSCSDLLDREIVVRSGEKSGRAFIRTGQVSHAAVGEIEGEEAFFEMFRWPGGEFDVAATSADAPVSIHTPWEHLLMEAMRARDESSDQPEEEKKQKMESFTQKVQKMKMAEKIKLAMLGDKEARTLLIRDPSRIIQVAVINNPRITDGEVTVIANTKSIDEEVLKRIARSREWMMSYAVRLALAKNPKTPLPIATKLVPTLMAQDLKLIAKSKAVPTPIALAAKRHLSQKE